MTNSQDRFSSNLFVNESESRHIIEEGSVSLCEVEVGKEDLAASGPSHCPRHSTGFKKDPHPWQALMLHPLHFS